MRNGRRRVASPGAHGPRAALAARVALVVAPWALIFAVPMACVPSAALVSAGGECFTATDCAPGLVCVPLKGGSRVCSSDLSQVVGQPPPEAGVDASADGPAEGAADGPPLESSVPDTNVPDTSVPDTSVADAADPG